MYYGATIVTNHKEHDYHYLYTVYNINNYVQFIPSIYAMNWKF